MRQLNQIEIDKARAAAELEAARFRATVTALTPATIYAVATAGSSIMLSIDGTLIVNEYATHPRVAGPALQVKLLQSLGLRSTLFTDGKSPINLFNTARGLAAIEH